MKTYTLLVTFAALLLVPYAGAVQAQQVAVQGRVVERATGDPISGATVQIAGMREVLTGPRGNFVIPGVPRGRRTLQVTMLGYKSQKIDFNAQRDTLLLIELDVEAVRLKDVTVQNDYYSVKGEVKEREHGLPVMDADILTSVRGSAARTNSAGRYRVSRLPVGPVTTIQVRGLGLLPVTINIDPQRDTTINFLLQPDPIGLRMLKNQVEKLETRAKSTSFHTEAFTRETLLERYYNFDVADILDQLLRQRVHGGGMQCLFIDEREARFGLIELSGFVPDEIERIELIDHGTMVRVYTRRWLQKMTSTTEPGPIMLMKALGFGKTICK